MMINSLPTTPIITDALVTINFNKNAPRVELHLFVLTILFDAILLCNPGADIWAVHQNQSLS